ncbi:AMP-dependent synthetase/ligase [Streptomyces sp. NPDC059477]|uniref:AMP-dependent synthetase/ligase n=1 Tax=Streptomyces sp. NPDC059477 TaxID=3346847 RepID=UPI0036CCB853
MREFTNPPLGSAPLVGGLADVVFERARDDPRHRSLSRRDDAGRWREVTAAEFRDEVLALAKGLLSQGVRFGDRVALMSRTRYEWTLFDYALWTIGAQVVPVYPTSSAEECHWVLHDAGVSAAVVEHEDQAMTLATVIERLPRLRRLWQLDAGALRELREAGAAMDDTVVHRHRRAVTPDSIATVVYTSGTTGRPKGCVLTHGNFMYQADTLTAHWEPVFRSRAGDEAATLLFLPLAHVFGRTAQVAAVRHGVRLGHRTQPGAAALLPELAAFRPTFVLAVPSLFEQVFHSARRTAEREGREGPFEKAVEVAVRHAEAEEARARGTGPGPSAALRMRHQVHDRLVYAKVRAALGGRLRHALSGGSAMDRGLGLFFAGAGIQIHEGYGLTETTGAATANPPGRTRHGSVGRPLPGVTVHLADDGEIWLRGDNVFKGYLNNPEATDETLYDGWLATGDLGALDDDGYLTLTGRKAEILVTSGGESVSPGPLEERVRDHPLISQCLVVGDGRPFVAALITLDAEAVEHWRLLRGKPALSPADLVRDADLEAEVRRAVVAASALVPQAGAIRTFRILARPFTGAQGLLTPSGKLRREAIERAYADEVAALYRS